MPKWKFGLSSFLSKLGRDERGSILLQFIITTVAMMGMIGLALDGGRLLMLHTDLHKLADAAALAGAAKLDGTANALTNADTAARALGAANNVHWADVSASNVLPLTAGVQFFSSLNPDIVSADPKTAKFIKVTTGNWQAAPTFLRAAGAISNISARGSAVARGPTAGGVAACFPQSMMLCNPSEPQGGGTGDVSTFNPTRGTMYVFSVQGNTGGFSPGVFNLLDTPSGSGADSDIKKFLSQQNINFCTTSGTSPAQGQKTNATKDGINVRFDQQPQGNTTGMDLTPAPVKITGWAPPVNNGGQINCNPSQLVDVSTPSPRLPRDSTLTPVAGGANGGTFIGNGVTTAQLQTYWTLHHGGTLPGAITTRYDVYRAEVPPALGGSGIGNGQTWLTDSPPPAGEPHGPQCASSSTMVPPEYNVKRRILKVAVVDCAYWGVQGNQVNNIPQNTYAEFFITEAVDNSGLLYTEFVAKHGISEGPNDTDGVTGGLGGCGTGGGLCPIVQLVR